MARIGAEQHLMLCVSDDNGAYNVGMTPMQHIDQRLNHLLLVRYHRKGGNGGKRLNNTGPRAGKLVLQLIAAVNNEERTEQQSDNQCRGQNQYHHASTQTVFGHEVPMWEN